MSEFARGVLVGAILCFIVMDMVIVCMVAKKDR